MAHLVLRMFEEACCAREELGPDVDADRVEVVLDDLRQVGHRGYLNRVEHRGAAARVGGLDQLSGLC